ncbi:phosphorylase family related protein [Cyclospora cayetanensis]|uniref:Phosphorylase family related protein n=1 Tax=Cyclospora cayetanensis TaxID=88456 RepID=A0A1D3D8N5_9EIME|nr:phosphorylase family related protein [Cyclospora cayetanensis]
MFQRGNSEVGTKRCIGVDPKPGNGQLQTHTTNSDDVRPKERHTFGGPSKFRSKTVASFLCPQAPHDNAGGIGRRRSSIEDPIPSNTQGRRNAIAGGHLGFSIAGTRGSHSTQQALDDDTVNSPYSLIHSTSCIPHQDQSCSISSRLRRSSFGRLNSTDTGSGSRKHRIGKELLGHRREATTTTSGRLHASTSHKPYYTQHKSLSSRKSSQSDTRESFEFDDTGYRSSTGRTSSTSARKATSVPEEPALRRHTSAFYPNQNRVKNVTAGADNAKNTDVGKVGFNAPSGGRLPPTTYLLSATRTRDSLLVPGEGRAYHLGVQHGELYNRILTVGHAGRADWLAERFLDSHMRTLSLKSNRNFRLHSGFYRRKPVSIVAFGMGAPMMDVLVREASYITSGPLAIVRLDLKPYTITRPCAADPELSRLIYRHVAAHDPDLVFEGLNASAETFYSCQAREDQLFRDENEDLLETLVRCGAQTLEMETHQLLHLASRRMELVKAAAVHIGVTSRTNDHFMHPITPSQLNELVAVAGKACLDALVDVRHLELERAIAAQRSGSCCTVIPVRHDATSDERELTRGARETLGEISALVDMQLWWLFLSLHWKGKTKRIATPLAADFQVAILLDPLHTPSSKG